jgi:4-aminobutyrate aminotransferase/(S)-3-amino-2-methylpropionate transaminase
VKTKAAPAVDGKGSALAGRAQWVARGVGCYHPIVIESAENARLRGVDGREYIDFAGGIGVVNVGHRHPKVVEAVKRQADRVLHACFQVTSYPEYIEVCRRLCEAAPGNFAKKAVLFSTGAEALENAVKIARGFTKRRGVVCFDGAFHGRTYMAMRMTGKYKPYRPDIGPFPGDVHRIPFPYAYRPPKGVAPKDLTAYCLERLEQLFQTDAAPEEIACVVVEPVQGEGGFVVPPADFLPALKQVCERHGILFVADEVQSGFGRTAKMFAIEHSGVVPDLMTVAKSLAAGMPLSGVVGRADVMDALGPGGLGGTYAGNPLACAAALAVFDIFEKERILAKAEKVGETLRKSFDRLAERSPFVGESRGLGAMRAIELVEDKKTKAPLAEAKMKQILTACAEKGLLVIKAGGFGNVIRCLVPLTVPEADLARGLEILEESVLALK